MTKESVLRDLQEIENDRKTDKQGNLMFYEMLDRLKKLVVTDRNGVVDAMRYWLSLRDQYLTEIAESIAQFLLLKELRPELEQIKKEILARKYYHVPYTGWIDMALKAFDDDDAKDKRKSKI
jgi:hypothetical protein